MIVLDLPKFPFASVDGDLNGKAAVASSSTSEAAAVLTPAPGMALTRENNTERVIDLPSFLRCARPAHGGMKPEAPRGVITIENQNIAGTP